VQGMPGKASQAMQSGDLMNTSCEKCGRKARKAGRLCYMAYMGAWRKLCKACRMEMRKPAMPVIS